MMFLGPSRALVVRGIHRGGRLLIDGSEERVSWRNRDALA
jgi:hypothetical protein